MDRKPAARERVSKRSVEIENLISSGRSLPAEFAIDILLRLAVSNSVDTKWKQEIFGEAFTLTQNVQNELRSKGLPEISADTRANYRSSAFDMSLDALSLRSRIINQIVSMDKSEALRMLGEISPKLRFTPLSCSDQMVYDVSDFYRMLGNVTQNVYDEKRIQQGERVQFLLPYIENMSSPVQVAPVGKLITSLHLRSKELFIVSQTFADALRKISGDDRSFSAALTQDRTANTVFQLIQYFKKQGVPHTEVASALRVYLSKHLSGARCEDNVDLIGTELPFHVKEINYFFPDSPFTINDLHPSKVEKGLVSADFFESKDSSKLIMDFKSLRGYDDDEPDTKELKTSAAWQQKMLDYLRQLEAWDGRNENSEVDYFHQKCVLYLALARIAPPGEAGDQVMLSYINLLNQNTALRESRIEWLLHANELLGLVRDRQGDERAKLLDLLLYSKNPTLEVYARLIKAKIK